MIHRSMSLELHSSRLIESSSVQMFQPGHGSPRVVALPCVWLSEKDINFRYMNGNREAVTSMRDCRVGRFMPLNYGARLITVPTNLYIRATE
jgi:hypothetical protein